MGNWFGFAAAQQQQAQPWDGGATTGFAELYDRFVQLDMEARADLPALWSGGDVDGTQARAEAVLRETFQIASACDEWVAQNLNPDVTASACDLCARAESLIVFAAPFRAGHPRR